MDRNFFIDIETYSCLLKSINNQLLFVGGQAQDKDMAFIKNNVWIAETAVIDRITRRRGMWCVDLVFAEHTNPLTLLIRNITAYSCIKKATIHSSIFRRQAAKDQRGTLKIELERYHLNLN